MASLLPRDHSDLEVVVDPDAPLQHGHDIEVNQKQMHVWAAENQHRDHSFAEEYYQPAPQVIVKPEPKAIIWNPRKGMFWLVVGLVAFTVIAAAVGGGVGGALAHKHSSSATKTSSSTASQINPPGSTASPNSGEQQTSSPVYQKSALAAMQWEDNSTVNHYRVFFQAKDGQILQSAWDSNTTGWQVSRITDDNMDVKLGTFLTAIGGYPHANLSWDLVEDVFFVSNDGTAYERQSPYKTVRGVWGNDNFSGQFTTSNFSSMTSFWYQDLSAGSQVFSVLFQEPGAESLQIAKFADSPWEKTTQNISIEDGSPLAVASTGTKFDLGLYLGDSNGKLMQYQYDLGTSNLSNPKTSTFDLPPQTPLCVSTQNNTGFFSDGTLPQCAQSTPLTHLILFATADRTSMSLVSWNCSTGFLDQTPAISTLLKPNRTYSGLASHGDYKVYVMFDEGDGPEIEQWQVPTSSYNGSWSVVESVPVNLTTTS